MSEKKCHLEGMLWYSDDPYRYSSGTDCVPHIHQCHSCKNYVCSYHYVNNGLCVKCMTLQCKWSDTYWFKKGYERAYMTTTKPCRQ